MTSLQNYFKSGACIAHIKSCQKLSFDYYAFASRGAPWLANTKAIITKWATQPTPRPLFPHFMLTKDIFCAIKFIQKLIISSQKTLQLLLRPSCSAVNRGAQLENKARNHLLN